MEEDSDYDDFLLGGGASTSDADEVLSAGSGFIDLKTEVEEALSEAKDHLLKLLAKDEKSNLNNNNENGEEDVTKLDTVQASDTLSSESRMLKIIELLTEAKECVLFRDDSPNKMLLNDFFPRFVDFLLLNELIDTSKEMNEGEGDEPVPAMVLPIQVFILDFLDDVSQVNEAFTVNILLCLKSLILSKYAFSIERLRAQAFSLLCNIFPKFMKTISEYENKDAQLVETMRNAWQDADLLIHFVMDQLSTELKSRLEYEPTILFAPLLSRFIEKTLLCFLSAQEDSTKFVSISGRKNNFVADFSPNAYTSQLVQKRHPFLSKALLETKGNDILQVLSKLFRNSYYDLLTSSAAETAHINSSGVSFICYAVRSWATLFLYRPKSRKFVLESLLETFSQFDEELKNSSAKAQTRIASVLLPFKQSLRTNFLPLLKIDMLKFYHGKLVSLIKIVLGENDLYTNALINKLKLDSESEASKLLKYGLSGDEAELDQFDVVLKASSSVPIDGLVATDTSGGMPRSLKRKDISDYISSAETLTADTKLLKEMEGVLASRLEHLVDQESFHRSKLRRVGFRYNVDSKTRLAQDLIIKLDSRSASASDAILDRYLGPHGQDDQAQVQKGLDYELLKRIISAKFLSSNHSSVSISDQVAANSIIERIQERVSSFELSLHAVDFLVHLSGVGLNARFLNAMVAAHMAPLVPNSKVPATKVLLGYSELKINALLVFLGNVVVTNLRLANLALRYLLFLCVHQDRRVRQRALKTLFNHVYERLSPLQKDFLADFAQEIFGSLINWMVLNPSNETEKDILLRGFEIDVSKSLHIQIQIQTDAESLVIPSNTDEDVKAESESTSTHEEPGSDVDPFKLTYETLDQRSSLFMALLSASALHPQLIAYLFRTFNLLKSCASHDEVNIFLDNPNLKLLIIKLVKEQGIRRLFKSLQYFPDSTKDLALTLIYHASDLSLISTQQKALLLEEQLQNLQDSNGTFIFYGDESLESSTDDKSRAKESFFRFHIYAPLLVFSSKAVVLESFRTIYICEARLQESKDYLDTYERFTTTFFSRLVSLPRILATLEAEKDGTGAAMEVAIDHEKYFLPKELLLALLNLFSDFQFDSRATFALACLLQAKFDQSLPTAQKAEVEFLTKEDFMEVLGLQFSLVTTRTDSRSSCTKLAYLLQVALFAVKTHPVLKSFITQQLQLVFSFARKNQGFMEENFLPSKATNDYSDLAKEKEKTYVWKYIVEIGATIRTVVLKTLLSMPIPMFEELLGLLQIELDAENENVHDHESNKILANIILGYYKKSTSAGTKALPTSEHDKAIGELLAKFETKLTKVEDKSQNDKIDEALMKVEDNNDLQPRIKEEIIALKSEENENLNGHLDNAKLKA